ncbi:hypothetical protein ANCCAN_07410, partial [Ancylostoma caninum]
LNVLVSDYSENYTLARNSVHKFYCWPDVFFFEKALWTYKVSGRTAIIHGSHEAEVNVTSDGVISCVVRSRTLQKKPLRRVRYFVKTVPEEQKLPEPNAPHSLVAHFRSNTSRLLDLSWKMEWNAKVPSRMIRAIVGTLFKDILTPEPFYLPPDTTSFSYFVRKNTRLINVYVDSYMVDGSDELRSDQAESTLRNIKLEPFGFTALNFEVVAYGSGMVLYWNTTGDEKDEITGYRVQ